MKNYIAEGENLTFTASADYPSGAGVVLGSLFGVAAGAIVAGQPGVIKVTGVFDLPKVPAETWTAGVPIFWNPATQRCTTSSLGTIHIGTAVFGASPGPTTGRVRLNGCAAGAEPVMPPEGLTWRAGYEFSATKPGASYTVSLTPRDLVDPAIWTGAAIHVDSVGGADAKSGLGSEDGDFSAAKKTIFAAFTAGNATGAPYRVIVKPGNFENSAFTSNGAVEPNQPVAIIGWGGRVNYRAGLRSQAWTLDTGTTYNATITSVMRLFRQDVLTAEGLFTELVLAPDLATCRSNVGTWFKDGANLISVNLGKVLTTTDVVVIRGFHGARFMTHTGDLYLENLDLEGGMSGALHCDPVASRNIVGVSCTFRYSSPSTGSPVPLDAVQIRRTNGLVAFWDSDASSGAKDGWNFHDDGNPIMHVLLVNCTGWRSGALGATSVNAFTTHDGVVAAVIGGRFGRSNGGTEVHCIENTKTWVLGAEAVARDPDGTCTAFKCSNAGLMWLQDTIADAQGGATANYGVEANDGGIAYLRNHTNLGGTGDLPSNGGQILTF